MRVLTPAREVLEAQNPDLFPQQQGTKSKDGVFPFVAAFADPDKTDLLALPEVTDTITVSKNLKSVKFKKTPLAAFGEYLLTIGTDVGNGGIDGTITGKPNALTEATSASIPKVCTTMTALVRSVRTACTAEASVHQFSVAQSHKTARPPIDSTASFTAWQT